MARQVREQDPGKEFRGMIGKSYPTAAIINGEQVGENNSTLVSLTGAHEQHPEHFPDARKNLTKPNNLKEDVMSTRSELSSKSKPELNRILTKFTGGLTKEALEKADKNEIIDLILRNEAKSSGVSKKKAASTKAQRQEAKVKKGAKVAAAKKPASKNATIEQKEKARVDLMKQLNSMEVGKKKAFDPEVKLTNDRGYMVGKFKDERYLFVISKDLQVAVYAKGTKNRGTFPPEKLTLTFFNKLHKELFG